jgi:hypothetical protein
MNIQGKIHVIKEVQQVTDTFKKREFVVQYDENPMYPQYVLFQMIQDKCDLINGFNVGDMVDVSFNIRGREWTSPQGEIKYFNTLDAWRISPLQTGAVPQAQPQAQVQPQQQATQPTLYQQGPKAQPKPDIQVPTGDNDDLPF